MDTPHSGTVLIVDDEPMVREVVIGILEPLKVTTIEVSDGKEAMAMLAAHPVDIIISDLMMPHMSGIELLESLRAANHWQPFLIVTGYSSPDTALAALRLGAFDLIDKPFDAQNLRRLAAEALSVSRVMRGIEVTPALQVAAPGAAPAASNLSAGARLPATAVKVTEFATEAEVQLSFCRDALHKLGDADAAAFELGYLFRVMQELATNAQAQGLVAVAAAAAAAERLYSALRVSRIDIGPEVLELGTQAHAALAAGIKQNDATTGAALKLVTSQLDRLTQELETKLAKS